MEATKKVRPVRPAAARNYAINNGAGANGHYDESDDDDSLSEVPVRPTAKRNPRNLARTPKVDFNKLDAASLHRYRRLYKLADAPPTTPKEDLIPAVARHFAMQTVDEEEILIGLAAALRRNKLKLMGQTLKKPRTNPMTINKPKPTR